MYGTKNSLQRYIPPSFAKKGLTDKDLKLPEINIGPFKQEVKRYYLVKKLIDIHISCWHLLSFIETNT